jgi:hypothetical protein
MEKKTSTLKPGTPMYDTRIFRIRLTSELLGTVSKDPSIFSTYIGSKKPSEIEEDESVNVNKTEEKGWTGFMQDPDSKDLFLYNYMFKGCLKAAGNTLKNVVNIKALRSKIDDFVFISPRKVSLGQDKPDGVNERPIRVLTPQGPRVALIRSDYIKAGKILEFEITLVGHPEISWATIETLLKHGQHMGLGQFRNGGFGQFELLGFCKKEETQETV